MTAEALFAAALEKPAGEERRAFLDTACAGDPDLRARVGMLLAADELARDLLNPPRDPYSTGSDRPPRADPPLAADALFAGRFKLRQKLGEGGMGEVWVADQSEPIQRRVAVKVIRRGLDTDRMLARFEAERQALALMDHPNIARFLDAGLADSQPYFVMELIKGVPITRYCDEARLTPRERIELFVPVCRAIQHAHQKGVIHRDLKPSNILVALYDGRPVPKVIDFGVAKATGPKLSIHTIYTEVGSLVGTLEYMSPEQAELNNLDIDTRTDVYALGVVLYELLTGVVPFPRERLVGAGLAEMLRIIKEEDPPKPSTRLSETATAPGVAAVRRVEPRKLAALVRGELDWIVMKALAKDRNRRYESATGLAHDLERFLTDQPVTARPPSAAYRVRKFVARNRAGVAAAVLAAITLGVLVVGGGAVAWQAERRRAEAAERDRDEYERRGRTAEAVAALLDQSEAALRADRADQAALALGVAERRAAEGGAEELQPRLAATRTDLDLLRELDAIDTFRWTWTDGRLPEPKVVADRWRVVLTGVPGRAAQSQIRERVLAALDAWQAADPAVDVREALRTLDPDPFREAVRDARVARDDAGIARLVDQAEALSQPARFAAVLGRFDAVPLDRRRAVFESALRARPGDLGLLMTLGTTYPPGRREGADERLRWYQAAVAAHPDRPAPHNSLALARWDHGDRAGAIAGFRAAIERDRGYATAHYNLGYALRLTGDPDGAVAAYLDALRLRPNHAATHNDLGNALRAKNDLDGAIARFREAARLNPSDPRFHGNLGIALREKGDAARAAASLREAVRLGPKLAPAHAELAWVLATGPDGVRDGKQAVEHATRAYELTGRKNAGYLDTLAAAHAEVGEFDKAVELATKALADAAFAKTDGEAVQARLGLYRQKQPYRDPALAQR